MTHREKQYDRKIDELEKLQKEYKVLNKLILYYKQDNQNLSSTFNDMKVSPKK